MPNRFRETRLQRKAK